MGKKARTGLGKNARTRKPYEEPTFKKLTPEARLKLVDLAGKGDEAANELLELTSSKHRKPKKKPA